MPDGRIPLRLRLGVTGHRAVADEETVATAVREALRRLRLQVGTPATPVVFTVVSSLAEGADRLVAREVLLEPGALLEAPLPLPRDQYRRDFQTQSSQREFDDLLGRAETVVEAETAARPEDGYAWAGQYVVDRSDVLLALWDGLPARGQGGTAHVVEYAAEQQRPVVWIRTAAERLIVEQLGDVPRRHDLEHLEELNRASVSPEDVAERLAALREKDRLTGAEATRVVGRAEADALSAWILPYLVRADSLALAWQRWFYRLTAVLYFAAAAAVAVVAVQAFLFPEHPELVWGEVALLALLVLVVFYGRRLRIQQRWLSYRFLAERFRSAFFLAACGVGRRSESRGLQARAGEDSPEDWVQRAFTEVWGQRPRVEARGGPEELRQLLAERWIGEQRRYYRDARRRFHRRHRVLLAGIYLAFLTTIAAAVPHALGVGHHSGEDDVFSILSLTLPALGAAFSGLLAQREYQRNAERYSWMEQALGEAEQRMRSAATATEVRRFAAVAETTLLEENRDWVGVMRFHDFEVA